MNTVVYGTLIRASMQYLMDIWSVYSTHMNTVAHGGIPFWATGVVNYFVDIWSVCSTHVNTVVHGTLLNAKIFRNGMCVGIIALFTVKRFSDHGELKK